MEKTRIKQDPKQERVSVSNFQKKILAWYRKSGRHDLPWRPPALPVRKDGICDPYKILVSEVMLQQTQVDRVIPKFRLFIKLFPTARTLAEASIRDLFSAWKGLGYNRRALYLQKAAQKIMQEFGGRFPNEPLLIETLPGVGHYTARAVAAFAFDIPCTFIETNIRRIFLHFFFSGQTAVLDDQILLLVEKALWRKSPRIWYSALMDYGALAMRNLENPNTRSRHYVRQSRFEGSRRYARAKILDFIAQSKKPCALSEIVNYASFNPLLAKYRSKEAILHIIKLLVADGFLSASKNGSKVALRK